MNHLPSGPTRADQLTQLANSLDDLRDSLVMASLALADLITEAPSPERDEVVASVQHYLNRFVVSRR